MKHEKLLEYNECIFDGRYVIERPLAQGGFGQVYLARQLSTSQAVICKALLPGHSTEAFERERDILARISHPNIVGLHEYGVHINKNGASCTIMVLSYIQGSTLAEFLRQNGPLELEQAVSLTLELLEGLEIVHAQGIIHCDIKPANVMIVGTLPSIQVVLIDFGIARYKGERMLDARDQIAGSPEWMDPFPLVDKQAVACPSTDVHSAGLVFWTLCTGKLPWRGHQRPFEAKLEGPTCNLPLGLLHGPAGLILRRATSVNLDRRYASVGEFIAALRSLDTSAKPVISRPLPPPPPTLAPAPTSTPPTPDAKTPSTPPAPNHARSVSRSTVAMTAMSVLIIGLLICIGWLLVKQPGEREPSTPHQHTRHQGAPILPVTYATYEAPEPTQTHELEGEETRPPAEPTALELGVQRIHITPRAQAQRPEPETEPDVIEPKKKRHVASSTIASLPLANVTKEPQALEPSGAQTAIAPCQQKPSRKDKIDCFVGMAEFDHALGNIKAACQHIESVRELDQAHSVPEKLQKTCHKPAPVKSIPL